MAQSEALVFLLHEDQDNLSSHDNRHRFSPTSKLLHILKPTHNRWSRPAIEMPETTKAMTAALATKATRFSRTSNQEEGPSDSQWHKNRFSSHNHHCFNQELQVVDLHSFLQDLAPTASAAAATGATRASRARTSSRSSSSSLPQRTRPAMRPCNSAAAEGTSSTRLPSMTP